MTERASWLSPARFSGVPFSGLYFLRFRTDGISVGPRLLSIGLLQAGKYFVRFIASSRPRPPLGENPGGTPTELRFPFQETVSW